MHIQGCIKTNSLLIGASLRNPGNVESKALAFKIYRYITVAHILMQTMSTCSVHRPAPACLCPWVP